MYRLTPKAFLGLDGELRKRGYTIVGPTERDGAITFDVLGSLKELPAGWIEDQDAGRYRISKNGDPRFFGFTTGPQSWKKFLFPPRHSLFAVERDGKELRFLNEDSSPTLAYADPEPDRIHQPSPVPSSPLALVGVRSCDLHAIMILDKVFTSGPYVDSQYKRRRDATFIVAVNCTRAGGTCFCTSMKTGPACTSGYDIVITEVVTKEEYYIVADSGSELGKEVLKAVSHTQATSKEIETAKAHVEKVAKSMGRTLSTAHLKETLLEHLDDPHWDDVAKRCMACTNCTLVCPTCFCSTVEDVTDLQSTSTVRQRRWDSCFTLEFSKVVGGNFRPSTKARYRQWLTHKFSSWVDQFGMYGCVGCGRCITWCPVGIDVTAEIKAIRSAHRPDRQQQKGA